MTSVSDNSCGVFATPDPTSFLNGEFIPLFSIPYLIWTYVFEKEAKNLSDNLAEAVYIRLSVLKQSIDKDGDLPSYSRKHIFRQRYSMQQIPNLYTLSLVMH